MCAGHLTHLARLGTVPTSEWVGGKRGTDGIWRSLDGIRSWLVAGRSVIGGRWWSTVVPNSYSANLQAAQRMSWVSLVPQCPQVATFSTFSMAIRECHIIAVSLDDAGGNVTAKPHTPAGLPPSNGIMRPDGPPSVQAHGENCTGFGSSSSSSSVLSALGIIIYGRRRSVSEARRRDVIEGWLSRYV